MPEETKEQAPVKPVEQKPPLGNPLGGLTQPASQNPVKPKEDNNPLPPSLREHKAVPSHPYQNLQNSAYKGDANAKPKTMDECIAEQKAKKK